MKDAETDATAESVNEEKLDADLESDTSDSKAIISSTKRSRPLYKFDPDKITLRFLFANRDGLTVTLECEPHDTVAEVKAASMSVWPEGKYCCQNSGGGIEVIAGFILHSTHKDSHKNHSDSTL
jgi:hypothetical protein